MKPEHAGGRIYLKCLNKSEYLLWTNLRLQGGKCARAKEALTGSCIQTTNVRGAICLATCVSAKVTFNKRVGYPSAAFFTENYLAEIQSNVVGPYADQRAVAHLIHGVVAGYRGPHVDHLFVLWVVWRHVEARRKLHAVDNSILGNDREDGRF